MSTTLLRRDSTDLKAEQVGLLNLFSQARACPFCRLLDQSLEQEDQKFYVYCLSCEAMGPEADSTEAAVALWNGEPCLNR